MFNTSLLISDAEKLGISINDEQLKLFINILIADAGRPVFNGLFEHILRFFSARHIEDALDILVRLLFHAFLWDMRTCILLICIALTSSQQSFSRMFAFWGVKEAYACQVLLKNSKAKKERI